MKRKSFFLSLVFAMLFFLFGGNVNVQAETTLEPYTYINPVYKDVLSDALPEAVTPYSLETPQNVSYTDDVQQLAATLRQQMLNRTTTIICTIIPILQLLRISWTGCLISFLILQWLIPETKKRAITFAGTAKDGRLVHPTLRLLPDITWILPLPCIICPTLLRKHRWIRQFPV